MLEMIQAPASLQYRVYANRVAKLWWQVLKYYLHVRCSGGKFLFIDNKNVSVMNP